MTVRSSRRFVITFDDGYTDNLTDALPMLERADVRDRLSSLPVSMNIGQPISHRLDHMLSGVRAEIALKIYGEDLHLMHETLEQVKQIMNATRGARDVEPSWSCTDRSSSLITTPSISCTTECRCSP